MTGKPWGPVSASFYIATHLPELSSMLEPRVRPEDMGDIISQLMTSEEYLAAMLENNFGRTSGGIHEEVLERLNSESLLVVMLGSRGAGKTAQFFHEAERIIEEGTRDVYWFGYSGPVRRYYPEIKQTVNLRKLEHAFLGFDEAAIFLGGRDSMTKERKRFIKHIPVMRHKDVTTMYLTQVEGIDKLIWQFCDWLWFKPYPQISFRGSTIENLNPVHQFMIPASKGQNYVYDRQNGLPYFFDTGKPSRWDDPRADAAMSSPYSLIKDTGMAVEFYEQLVESGLSQGEITTMLELRGWTKKELLDVLDSEMSGDAQKGPKKAEKPSKLSDTLREGMCPRCGGELGPDGTRLKKVEGQMRKCRRMKCRECGKTVTGGPVE